MINMTTTTTLVPTTNMADLLKGGSLVRVLEALKPIEKSAGKKVIHIPKRVALNERVAQAVANFPKTITEAVCPDTRRILVQDEVTKLLREREDLDLIEKVIAERKEAQRVIVFNHHDVSIEAEGGDTDAEVDSKGWYLIKRAVGSPEFDKGFVRTIQENSPSLSAAGLEALIGTEGFTKEDYLACTTQTRVLDEAKVLLHIRKRPEIVAAISKAITPGSKISKHGLGKVES